MRDTDQLKYNYVPTTEEEQRQTGGTGGYYDIPTQVTPQELPSAVQDIANTIYNAIDTRLDTITSLGNTMLSTGGMSISNYIGGMYNIHSIPKTEVNNLSKITISHPIYATAGILALSRRSWETYDISNNDILSSSGLMGVEHPALQPFMHRAYCLYYNSLLTNDWDALVTDIQKGNISNLISVPGNQYDPDYAYVVSAMQWLKDKKFPMDTVMSLLGTNITSIQNQLMAEVSNAINLVTYYMTYVPHMISNALTQAQEYALNPLYQAISNLPHFSSDVDRVLMDIINSAQEITLKQSKAIQEQLKLSKFEEELYKRQVDLIGKMNKYINIQNIIVNINDLSTKDKYTEV